MPSLDINPIYQQKNPDAEYPFPDDLFDDAAETDALTVWDDDYDDGDYDIDDSDRIYYDDLEPLSEYDDELRQPLYVISDDDATLHQDIMVDQWVNTRLRDATPTEKAQIAALLRELNLRRLQRWLPWLNQQEWNGHSLLVFLHFRKHWDANPHWWDISFWDRRVSCWYPVRSRYSLSLNASYELVHRRLEHSPGVMIDEAWLADWLELHLWERGFPSFASFAVFRAGFQPGENWQRHLDDPPATDDDAEERSRIARISPYLLYASGPPLWFHDQDWYDPSEWHDNLGW